MRALTFALVTVLALSPLAVRAAESEEEEAPAKEGAAQAETRSIAPLQAREVIERLKTMRAQLLLEQEYNRLLEARLERQELEAKLAGTKTKDGKDVKPEADRVRPDSRPLPPPPKLESATEQLVVKAVTVAPFKEAIVTYKGRVYTVRPGDKLGGIEIRDVNDSGVVTSGSGSQRTSVLMGQ